jgi:hypothetical protein
MKRHLPSPTSSLPIRLGLLVGLAVAGLRAEARPAARPGPADSGRSLVVMDPVNLEANAATPEWGAALRRVFVSLPAWKVHSVDSVAKKLREYNINPAAPCHEFQCAFDAGNILMSEFVAFGTVTRVDDWQAFTLNLVHMRTSQVVFSQAGEVRRGTGANPGAAMESAFRRMLEGFDPAKPIWGSREKRGLITVLDLSPGMTASRVITDRLATHLQGSRTFDIMTQQEQRELLAALEIDIGRFAPSDSGIFWLGGKMGVSHLLYSRLSGANPDYSLGLALYDMQAHRKVREWPTKSMGDFRKLLLNEDKFFSGLLGPQALSDKPGAPGRKTAGIGKGWYWAGAGLGVALTALTAFQAVSASSESDRQYSLYKQSLSSQEARTRQNRVERKDRETLAFSGASGLCALLSAASFTLAF